MYTLSTFSVVVDLHEAVTGFPAQITQGRTDFNIELSVQHGGVSLSEDVLSVTPVIAHHSPVGGVIRVLRGVSVDHTEGPIVLPGHLLYTDFSGSCSITFELRTATDILYTPTFLYLVTYNPAYTPIYTLYGIHPPIFQDGIQIAPLLDTEVVEPYMALNEPTPSVTFSQDTEELAELKRRVQQLEIIAALQAGNQLGKQEHGGGY